MAPPRKRKPAPAEPAASSKKKKQGKISNKDEEEAIDISSLYNACVTDSPKNRRAACQSVNVEQVWRTLVRTASNGSSSSNTNHWKQGCELIAVLVTQEGHQGGLEFVDDPKLFAKLVETVAHPIQANQDNDVSIAFWENLATMTLFINLTWTAAQTRDELQSEVLQKHIGSTLGLWYWMPERRRTLELKQRGLEKEYDEALKHLDTNKAPVVVSLVKQLLHVIQGSQLKLGRKNSTTQEDYNDEEQGEEQVVQEMEYADLLLNQWIFVHRVLAFLLDALSITRSQRFVAVYLQSLHFILQCRLSLGASTFSRADENMFLAQQLLDRIDTLLKQYPVVFKGADLQYQSLSPTDQLALYHARATVLQKLCHRYYAELVPDLVYAGVGLLCSNAHFIRDALGGLQDAQLLELLHKMRLVDSANGRAELYSREFLLNVVEDYILMPPNPVEELQTWPLYPQERILWDWTKIPPSLSSLLPASRVLSLPKLSSARFLSFLDYLYRNFELMRLETAYEIRSDLVDAIKRLRPVLRQTMADDEDDNPVTKLTTEFTGWARMALELGSIDGSNIKIIKVSKPALGKKHPEQVLAEISIDLKPCGDSIRKEWDELGEFDNLFMVAIDAARMTGSPAPLLSEYHLQHGNHHRWENDKDRRVPDEDDSTFPDRFGVTLVRGCMILQVRDEEGNVISEPSSGKAVGTKRTFRVAMDPAQYTYDKKSQSGTDIYQSLNLVVRRKGKENNFKAVLETIRGLMLGMGSIDRVIPPWLQIVLLGHGDPSAASYNSETMKEYAAKTVGVAKPGAPLDFGDTFINEAHLRESFRDCKIEIEGRAGSSTQKGVRKNFRIRFVEDSKTVKLHVEPYPFPEDFAGNPVPFTPVQVDAIRSGLSPGLTMVVGPPGTGKTDVAVQIIASLYHSFPTQRTVVITHSNAALNDIFQKVMARGDVDERYLVRLGSGERDLQTDSTHDFTKAGRVAYSVHRRGEALEKVQQLSESLGLSGKAERGPDGSPSYTCETAEYFYENHVTRRIRSFYKLVEGKDDSSDAKSEFPFVAFFKADELDLTVAKARECFDKLKAIFDELAEYRPLELLRSQRQRTDYLLMRQAKVVAMTCTHAAIARGHLIELGFEYDNIVVEEAGQMTEIETFVPLLLQKGETREGSASRLKRVCLMGDHNQLPPVIKNMTFSNYSCLDQSMFSRLIKLGVSHIQLDKQGRARPEIARLYSWRYNNLGDLSHVSEGQEYIRANAGLAHPFQVINVENFQGKGETTPTAHFFQNVGEAEYAVALFQYMVLIGYPSEKISILTTYNGQKELISDILSQRCGAGTPLEGVRPNAVSTVDQYQGQQNDYVILSLVRTEMAGHLRDVRRLVVAVSRARLGLYIFCRQELFAGCHELKRTFDILADKPSKLVLISGETYPTERKTEDPVPDERVCEVDDATDLGSLVYQMQEDMLKLTE